MKVLFFITLVLAAQVDAQFWKYSQQFFNPFSWIRQGKAGNTSAPATPIATYQTPIPLMQAPIATPPPPQPQPPQPPSTIPPIALANSTRTTPSSPQPLQTTKSKQVPIVSGEPRSSTTKRILKTKSTTPAITTTIAKQTTVGINKSTVKHTLKTNVWTTVPITTQTSVRGVHRNVTDKIAVPVVAAATATAAAAPVSVSVTGTTAPVTEASTMLDTTTQEVTGTTEEPRDNHRVHDFYLSKREKPQVKIASNISQNLLPLPAGASAALVKPTKYHYYPHNQHIYLLPECAIQQVCNAVYVRLNWTQPLCACPSRYRDPCSASLNSDDQHTTELMTDRKSKRALTLVKTCEPTTEMRICRSPRDWSLLALQNIRTGKSHYLVICRCPDTSVLEGPMSHDQPTYASVPGIRVYGMMCVQAPNNKRRGRPLRLSRSLEHPPFPWAEAVELAKTAIWD